MNECTNLESLLTAYVDGDASSSERERVSWHLQRCPRCHARVEAESAVHALIASRRASLKACVVSEALRSRCAAAAPARTSVWWGRMGPLAAAASVVLALGGTFLYQATAHSSRVMAAGLVVDHVKCFKVNHLARLHAPVATEAEQWVARTFGWHVDLPAVAVGNTLQLTAARPCLYGEGRVAHLMYEHNGRDVSVYMLPGDVREREVLEVLGQQASIWSASGRTFVVMAEDPAEVQFVARAVQTAWP